MTPDEAFETGRIRWDQRQEWQDRFDTDPIGTGEVLAILYPVFGNPE